MALPSYTVSIRFSIPSGKAIAWPEHVIAFIGDFYLRRLKVVIVPTLLADVSRRDCVPAYLTDGELKNLAG
jgi:hypothetical protein